MKIIVMYNSPGLQVALPFSTVDTHLVRESQKGKRKEQVLYTPKPKTLGQHLVKRRTDLQVTRKSVAARLGVSTSSLSMWEDDTHVPDIRHIKKVIEFIGYYPFEEPKYWREKITKYRRIHGLSLKEFGHLLGVDMATVCTWENGRYTPSIKTIERIDALIG